MNNWYLRNGWVDREGRIVREDVLIVDGKTAAFGEEAAELRREAAVPVREYHAEGKLISHGFVDLHVHLREPGYESKETIASGTKAAAAGGFTLVYAMPNTNPPLDTLTRLDDLEKRIRQDAYVKVVPIAAATRERAGRGLNDYAGFSNRGITLFSDDGDPVEAEVIAAVMEKLADLGGVLINHLEDKSLVNPGIFADSIPPESEYRMLERDLELVAKTNCRYHAAHLSCAESVELIAQAKAAGLPVTAEVTPHHLTLTRDDITEPLGHFQMKPPLRTHADREALIEGVRTGIIDAIATDHAPHGREKERGISSNSPFGVTGLETAFPVLYTKLVKTGKLELERLLRALTTGPGKVVAKDFNLAVGRPADLTVIDLELVRIVKPERFFSRGTNSPYIGETLEGWPVLTLVNGMEKYSASERGGW